MKETLEKRARVQTALQSEAAAAPPMSIAGRAAGEAEAEQHSGEVVVEQQPEQNSPASVAEPEEPE